MLVLRKYHPTDKQAHEAANQETIRRATEYIEKSLKKKTFVKPDKSV